VLCALSCVVRSLLLVVCCLLCCVMLCFVCCAQSLCVHTQSLFIEMIDNLLRVHELLCFWCYGVRFSILRCALCVMCY